MSCTSSKKLCFCDVRTGALSVAVYKVIFTSICLILSAVGADIYKEAPKDSSERYARIHNVIGGALIALTIFCTLLLGFNVMLLWAIIKRKTGHIKWWIRLTVVIEVLIVSSMFMSTWDTLRGFCLGLNFVLNIFMLRAVCAYQRELTSDTKGSVLNDAEIEPDQSSHDRLSTTESQHSSESPKPASLHEEKTRDKD